MTKQEIKAQLNALLAAGNSKAAVFAQLAGCGIKDSQLAYLLAAHAEPQRCAQHRGKVLGLIALMLAMTALACALGFGLGAHFGLNAQWLLAALLAVVPLFFVWGFYQNRAGAYNAAIFLFVAFLPQEFSILLGDPLPGLICLAINIAILAWICYVRHRLFPDFFLMSPRQVNGHYVFAEAGTA